MCGIVGVFGQGYDAQAIRQATARLAHRGPDDSGEYRSPDGWVMFGHRRLAIIDPQGGHQPISNEDGTVWAVFNGEIYNHLDLRRQLERSGHCFRTRCDAEVIVHAWEEFGHDFVRLLNGEFAIALYDQRQRRGLLARDRLGIRPLLFTELGGRLYFASELKALVGLPGFTPLVEPRAVDQYLALRYVAGERTMLRDVRRLAPGTLMHLSPQQRRTQRWWSVPLAPQRWRPAEAEAALDTLLRESVAMRLMSDVPLGMFLSGGIDSALILALMSRLGDGPVHACTIGFGLPLDETASARAIARHFRAHHDEIVLPRDAFQHLPHVVSMLDEPIGDIIILPTFWLASHAARSVKVVLTGEGADEIFGSYIHHYVLHLKYIYERLCPRSLRALNRWLLEHAPQGVWDRLFPYPERPGEHGRRRARLLLTDNGRAPYLDLVQLFAPAERASLCRRDWFDDHLHDWQQAFTDQLDDGPATLLDRLIHLDARYWLPDYTLLKQDRMTMANSLEGRVPFLDHRLVELLATIPGHLKQRRLRAKFLLRRVARRYLPDHLLARRKQAFYLPVARFFGPDFHDFVRDTLAPRAVADDGFFETRPIQILCERGLTGELLDTKRLMAILIFTLWARHYGVKPCPATATQ